VTVPSFYIKRGDRLPAFTRTLEDANGNPVDLTGGTVQFRMLPVQGGSLITGAATVTAATAGLVRYNWAAGDTDLVGMFLAEWEATFSGQVETFPNGGYDVVRITADLR
jgi:hypothetical protein